MSTIQTDETPFVAETTCTVDWASCNVCGKYHYGKGLTDWCEKHGEHCAKKPRGYDHTQARDRFDKWLEGQDSPPIVPPAKKKRRRSQRRSPTVKKPDISQYDLAKASAAHHRIVKPENNPEMYLNRDIGEVVDMFYPVSVKTNFFFQAWEGKYKGHFYHFGVLGMSPSGEVYVGWLDKSGKLLHDGNGNVHWQCLRPKDIRKQYVYIEVVPPRTGPGSSEKKRPATPERATAPEKAASRASSAKKALNAFQANTPRVCGQRTPKPNPRYPQD